MMGSCTMGQGERAGSCCVGGFHRPPVHRLQDRVAGGEEGVGALRQLLVTIVHPFPAPFHHNAFFASRALHIADSTNSSLVYPLLELIFANQDSFSNLQTEHEVPASIVSRLIALAVELGISQNSFGAGFNNSHTDQATRISFKYGCSRGVVGTPTYFVNGVTVGGADESWSVNEWAKVFDPLVKTPGFILES